MFDAEELKEKIQITYLTVQCPMNIMETRGHRGVVEN